MKQLTEPVKVQRFKSTGKFYYEFEVIMDVPYLEDSNTADMYEVFEIIRQNYSRILEEGQYLVVDHPDGYPGLLFNK